ncbi:hypothetical protein HY256_09280 [Candidatus Sumerlaeota bacterium]|nr:hypothetical protein [Candidatus Sumerlaeota bacterium]
MPPILIKILAAVTFSDVAIVIENGSARTLRGTVRPVILSEFSDLAAHFGIKSAFILAGTSASGFRLSLFGVPDAAQQRFRNVWGCHWR